MEKEEVLIILDRIDNLLFYDDIALAKEYIMLEKDNLRGMTPKKCWGGKQEYSFCRKCSNTNCPDNKSAVKYD